MFTIWLKLGEEDKVDEIIGDELEINVDEISQRMKIEIDADPFDPTFFPPQIPEDLVDHFTSTVKIEKESASRAIPEGTFEREKDGTIVRIKKVNSDKYKLYIKAPHIEGLTESYSHFLQDKVILSGGLKRIENS